MNIRTAWHKKWYIVQKCFWILSIVSAWFLGQNVLLPPHQNVLILFVNIRTMWDRKLYMKFDIVQKSLWILFDFLDSKCANNTYPTDTSRLKCLDFSCKQYIICEYSYIFHKTLCMYTWYNLKTFINFINFSCLTFWDKMPVIPNLYTTLNLCYW